MEPPAIWSAATTDAAAAPLARQQSVGVRIEFGVLGGHSFADAQPDCAKAARRLLDQCTDYGLLWSVSLRKLVISNMQQANMATPVDTHSDESSYNMTAGAVRSLATKPALFGGNVMDPRMAAREPAAAAAAPSS